MSSIVDRTYALLLSSWDHNGNEAIGAIVGIFISAPMILVSILLALTKYGPTLGSLFASLMIAGLVTLVGGFGGAAGALAWQKLVPSSLWSDRRGIVAVIGGATGTFLTWVVLYLTILN